MSLKGAALGDKAAVGQALVQERDPFEQRRRRVLRSQPENAGARPIAIAVQAQLQFQRRQVGERGFIVGAARWRGSAKKDQGQMQIGGCDLARASRFRSQAGQLRA